ncbi:MAG: alpha/beta hydrolase [Candidatus Rokubacteria bacterium]|nr:alpha/beta hydrolase [Candidatus Rokubacteria bacterium]
MFEGFTRERVRTSEAEIDLVRGGTGPPLLLLHGYPQTKAMWHRVAPGLAAHFTVVAPDLRGYGASSHPPDADDHRAYSKRAMGADQVEVMARLGFPSFLVAGHDRGGRVAYRLALDHPDRVRKLAVLDIVPTYEQFARVDRHSARAGYHWYFLAQARGFPERLIGADPEFFLRHMLRDPPGLPDPAGVQTYFSDEAFAEYLRCFRDPEVIHATCEDYRAGGTIDYELDEADLTAGRRVQCPVLALWGGRGRRQQVIETWQRWATDVRGRALSCGHFLAEEAPDETLAALTDFFLEQDGRRAR